MTGRAPTPAASIAGTSFSGNLFSGRYKSLLVSGQGGYLRTVCEYVHLNPARAKLLPAEEPLRSYRWSSFPEYLQAPSQRAAWLRVDRVLGECGIPKDSPAGRREFERVVEARRGQEQGEAFAGIRRGWCLGDETFRQELLERVSVKAGPQHYGRNWRNRRRRRRSGSWWRNWPSTGGSRKT